MNDIFIPYQEALNLKDLGFKEICLGVYILNPDNTITHDIGISIYNKIPNNYVNMPLYSQAFKWFRDKYNLIFQINYLFNGNYQVVIHKNTHKYMESTQNLNNYCIDELPDNYSYEEAEKNCLKKLIEIVKSKS